MTETSTERRIIFSPEVKGSQIHNARSEWVVVGEIAARVKPEIRDKVHFTSTQAIREEIAQVVPFYAGIENLKAEGDQFQYGGAMLCEGWDFPTTTGKANFRGTPLPQISLAENEFMIVTRRGKQFNSIINEDKDTTNQYQT